MPQAVVHFVIPIVIGILIWKAFQTKKPFPLAYALALGIGGIVPDIDYALFWPLYSLGIVSDLALVHRTYTHSLLFPLAFLLIGLVLTQTKLTLKNHKAGLLVILFSAGSLIHICLDALIAGYVMPLYPLSMIEMGTGLLDTLEKELRHDIIATLDGAVFVLTLVYLVLTKKLTKV